jgi:hypothetical protein
MPRPLFAHCRCAHFDVERVMRIILVVMPVLALAGCAGAAVDERPNPRNPGASVPPVAYRSAFEGYRAFADEEQQDWRKANEEVGAAGGHAGHRPGQGAGQKTSKPQPGKPESSGAPTEHGGHK